jgi:hypothetical protein
LRSGLSLCFFLSITIWVTPGNRLAKGQLRGFSLQELGQQLLSNQQPGLAKFLAPVTPPLAQSTAVLLQDFQGPQRVHPFSFSPSVQICA